MALAVDMDRLDLIWRQNSIKQNAINYAQMIRYSGLSLA